MIGLGLAVERLLNRGIENVSASICEKADLLRKKLSELDFISLHEQGKRKGGIVCFTVENMDSSDVKNHFFQTNPIVNLHVSLPSSTPSDAEWRNLPPLVRASISYYNTIEEIEIFCKLLIELHKTIQK